MIGHNNDKTTVLSNRSIGRGAAIQLNLILVNLEQLSDGCEQISST